MDYTIIKVIYSSLLFAVKLGPFKIHRKCVFLMSLKLEIQLEYHSI